MRRSRAASLATAAALALLLAAAPTAAQAPAAGEFAALREQCIAAAHDTQQREQEKRSLEHQIELLGRDAAGRQRGLDESRAEQERLLGVLVALARNLPARPEAAFASPIERLRSEAVAQATLPQLRAEARALSGEIARVAALHGEAAVRLRDLPGVEAALTADRDRLAQFVAQRQAAVGRVLPDDPREDAAIAKLARDAKDDADLVKRADAAAERRDKQAAAHARPAAGKDKAAAPRQTADQPEGEAPREFAPPQTALTMPVAGAIEGRFGAADSGGAAAQGLMLAAGSAAVATAPFDGRVTYAGPFRKQGLVLIIRHGRLYHSLLAGLGRVDVKLDQSVRAGEPIGAMPDAAEGAGTPLYFELRRDSQPVDPQPWLASRDDGRDGQNGDQRVRQ